jgi:small basic protein
MWILFVGLAVGIAVGLISPVTLPLVYGRYLSIALLAALDTFFGGLRSSLERTYDDAVFISGFFMNALLAAGFVYLGDRLGLETLYLGAIVALALRIFNNLGIIRRALITRWRNRGSARGT